MSKYILATIMTFAALFSVPSAVSAEEQLLQVTVSTGDISQRAGSFSPDSFTVAKGDEVTLELTRGSSEVWCCGVVVESADGTIRSAEIENQPVALSFTAEQSRILYAVWQESGLKRSALTIAVSGEAAPVAPAGLTQSFVGEGFTDLNWLPQDGVTTYRVYRDSELVAETRFPFFTDTGRAAGTTPTYEVSAVNTAGESGRSVPVQVTIQGLLTGAARQAFYEFVEVDGLIYPPASVPKTVPEVLILSGRSSVSSLLTIALDTDDAVVYTTVPDAAGFWMIDVDTSTLSARDYNVTMTYSGEDGEISEDLFTLPFAPALAPQSAADADISVNTNQPLGFGLMFASLITMLAALVLYLMQRPSAPQVINLTTNAKGEITTG